MRHGIMIVCKQPRLRAQASSASAIAGGTASAGATDSRAENEGQVVMGPKPPVENPGNNVTISPSKTGAPVGPHG
jgi:hypothetical protein